MDDATDHVLRTLRQMAWERAKGELYAYLGTWWPQYGRDGKEVDQGFDDASDLIRKFIKEFEDNCL